MAAKAESKEREVKPLSARNDQYGGVIVDINGPCYLFIISYLLNCALEAAGKEGCLDQIAYRASQSCRSCSQGQASSIYAFVIILLLALVERILLSYPSIIVYIYTHYLLYVGQE